jgi:hypothetical protein
MTKFTVCTHVDILISSANFTGETLSMNLHACERMDGLLSVELSYPTPRYSQIPGSLGPGFADRTAA